MIPTRADVTQSVLSLLGDTQATGGSLYTAAFQAPHLNLAYQELFTKLSMMSADRIQREGYYVLPAYTGIFTPSLAGLTNFGGPVEVRERGSVTTYALSGALTANPSAGLCRLTVAALPAAVVTGNQVEVYNVGGLSDDVNDAWYLTVNSTTSVDLNGCTATGTYTSGGVLAYSTEQWSEPLTPEASNREFATVPSSAIGAYSWQSGKMRVQPVNATRELKLLYHLSSSLPVATQVSTDSMGVDDSIAYLSNRVSQYCGASKGNPRAEIFKQQADYFLGLLLGNAGKQMQEGEPIIPPPFRPNRNARPYVW